MRREQRRAKLRRTRARQRKAAIGSLFNLLHKSISLITQNMVGTPLFDVRFEAGQLHVEVSEGERE